MPTTVRINDPTTALDVAPALLRLPDFFAEEVATQIRGIVIARLQQLTPKRSGRLAGSYMLLPVRIVERQDPAYEIQYTYYGRWVDFVEPVQVGAYRVETVDALIAAVMRDSASQVYTQALRNLGNRVGVNLDDFNVNAELRSFVTRRLLSAIINRTEAVLSTRIGRSIGRSIAKELREQNFIDLLEFANRF